MVKKLKSEDFLSELAKFYTASKDKYSVYLTMKRMYTETQKYKNNSAKRKLRIKDRLEQDKENKQFNVMVRAKLRKQRIHTIITPDELSRFHKNLTNVLIMHFITEERKKKEKKIAEKKISKTQKRKIKKLKKINKMAIEK
jgi:copper homeostasis protein CutC